MDPDTDTEPDPFEQPELPFSPGDLRGLPWAAIIVTSKRAAALEERGEIEWAGDAYRETGQPIHETAAPWLAVISRSLENTRIDPWAFRVLAHLIWRAGKRGRCWPSYEQIADSTGVSRRGVARAIKTLVERGMISYTQGHKGSANCYAITALLDEEPDPVEPVFYMEGTETDPVPVRHSKNGDEPDPVPVGHSKSENHAKNAPTQCQRGTPTLQPYSQENKSEQSVDLFGQETGETPSVESTRELFAYFLPPTITANVEVMLALGRFEKSRREARRKMTPTGIKALCRKIATWDPQDIIDAADAATEAGWLSLYPPKGNARPQEATQSAAAPKDGMEAWINGKSKTKQP